MKKIIQYFAFAMLAVTLVQACGKGQKQKPQAKQNSISQARQDSLAKVQAERDAKQAEEMMRQKQMKDTVKTETKEAPSNPSQIEFDPKGLYAVQVGSWRSVDFASKRKDTWKKRGYTDAYIVKYGDEKTGNVWFRVRLGRFSTKEMAQKEQDLLKQKYNTTSWISFLGNEK